MNNSAAQELSPLSLVSRDAQGRENIIVEQFQPSPGEGNCYFSDDHTICVSLAPRPVRLLQIRDGKTYAGLYGKGDISITPAQVPVFARWDEEDHYSQIRIAARFLQQVARESLAMNPDRLELLSEFRIRDPQVEAIAHLLLAELKQENFGSQLYIDSLANVLAVHLIRRYTIAKPRRETYGGGIAERQLRQVLDYIHDHLDQDLKLADLATVVGMSQFHFSHVFKQALGVAPYQYLLQQRVERAKHLLKHTDQSIMDIAFLCGFNSHSHLSKQFRQLTGMTPKAYRTD